MPDFNKFNSFVEALALKKHNLATDQLKVALVTFANMPTASGDAVLADITQIAYTNLSTRNIVTISAAQVAGLFSLKLTNLTLTAGGGPVATFRGVVIYNDTAANDELIGWCDVGVDVTLLDTQTYIITFDPVNGLLDLQ